MNTKNSSKKYTSQLVESIRILNGRVYNLKHHENRCNYSRKSLFDSQKPIRLRKHIDIPKKYRSGLIKCRILYGQEIQSIEFEKYKAKPITSLQCVYSDKINYEYKYVDRKQLDLLYAQRKDCSDIIIIKNDELTDSYYANVALFDGSDWYTPKNCLLKGTRRAQLLDKNRMKIRKIKLNQLNRYQSISLFNALIPFKQVNIPIESIYR